MELGGIGVELQFKLGGHEVKQVAPRTEDKIAGEGAQVVEEGAPRAKFLADQLVVA